MLAVITDDFTGASEIAGIALSKGYSAVIETQNVSRPDADVLVIATDMRSLDPASAARKSAKLTEQVLALGPDLIFKKVDSVLRGNIGPELEAQMKIEKKPRALLVPANPSRSRTIADGVYYVDSIPVAESGFALNHDFASPTSRVVDILLNRGTSRAICVSPGEAFQDAGVHIGNTQNGEDMRNWAGSINEELVPAGAADFFAAILDAKSPAAKHNGAPRVSLVGERALYICGSNFPSSRQAVLDAKSHGACVADMPGEIYYRHDIDDERLESWAKQVENNLRANGSVIVTASHDPGEVSLSGRNVTAAMAEVTRRVVDGGSIDDLMIEGGATAQAVMAALDIDCLYPTQTLAPGVTRMKVDSYPNLHITMKPGSYQWPASVWKFNQ
jgi:uncharacterized protein YgbK (DUF1537 family)